MNSGNKDTFTTTKLFTLTFDDSYYSNETLVQLS